MHIYIIKTIINRERQTPPLERKSINDSLAISNLKTAAAIKHMLLYGIDHIIGRDISAVTFKEQRFFPYNHVQIMYPI